MDAGAGAAEDAMVRLLAMLTGKEGLAHQTDPHVRHKAATSLCALIASSTHVSNALSAPRLVPLLGHTLAQLVTQLADENNNGAREAVHVVIYLETLELLVAQVHADALSFFLPGVMSALCGFLRKRGDKHVHGRAAAAALKACAALIGTCCCSNENVGMCTSQNEVDAVRRVDDLKLASSSTDGTTMVAVVKKNKDVQATVLSRLIAVADEGTKKKKKKKEEVTMMKDTREGSGRTGDRTMRVERTATWYAEIDVQMHARLDAILDDMLAHQNHLARKALLDLCARCASPQCSDNLPILGSRCAEIVLVMKRDASRAVAAEARAMSRHIRIDAANIETRMCELLPTLPKALGDARRAELVLALMRGMGSQHCASSLLASHASAAQMWRVLLRCVPLASLAAGGVSIAGAGVDTRLVDAIARQKSDTSSPRTGAQREVDEDAMAGAWDTMSGAPSHAMVRIWANVDSDDAPKYAKTHSDGDTEQQTQIIREDDTRENDALRSENVGDGVAYPSAPQFDGEWIDLEPHVYRPVARILRCVGAAGATSMAACDTLLSSFASVLDNDDFDDHSDDDEKDDIDHCAPMSTNTHGHQRPDKKVVDGSVPASLCHAASEVFYGLATACYRIHSTHMASDSDDDDDIDDSRHDVDKIKEQSPMSSSSSSSTLGGNENSLGGKRALRCAESIIAAIMGATESEAMACARLRTVGCIASAIGDKFTTRAGLLPAVILPSLSCLGDGSASPGASSTRIGRAATRCCALLAQSCGYGSLTRMVQANADHIVDGMCLQLRDVAGNPRAPRLFSALLTRSGAAHTLLPLLAEPMQLAVGALSVSGGRLDGDAAELGFIEIISAAAGAARRELRYARRQIARDALDRDHGDNDEMMRDNSMNGEGGGDVARVTLSAAKLAHAAMHAAIPFVEGGAALGAVVRALTAVTHAMYALGDAERCSVLLKQRKPRADGAVSAVDATHIPRVLPAVHAAWPALLRALRDTRTPVVLAGLELLPALATASGGRFISRRFADDAWPRVLDPLLREGVTLPVSPVVRGGDLFSDAPSRASSHGRENARAPGSLSSIRTATRAVLVHLLSFDAGEACIQCVRAELLEALGMCASPAPECVSDVSHISDANDHEDGDDEREISAVSE